MRSVHSCVHVCVCVCARVCVCTSTLLIGHTPPLSSKEQRSWLRLIHCFLLPLISLHREDLPAVEAAHAGHSLSLQSIDHRIVETSSAILTVREEGGGRREEGGGRREKRRLRAVYKLYGEECGSLQHFSFSLSLPLSLLPSLPPSPIDQEGSSVNEGENSARGAVVGGAWDVPHPLPLNLCSQPEGHRRGCPQHSQ